MCHERFVDRAEREGEGERVEGGGMERKGHEKERVRGERKKRGGREREKERGEGGRG